MRIAFLGSPAFAVPALQALAAEHEIAAVYCQPPRPANRGQALTRCAVNAAADAMGLLVRTPARVRRDAAEHAAFAELNLDAAIVAAYGLILPREMLEAPRLGCLNIHASLLPRWRGAAPIHAAILAGDAETGITIMQMDEGLDTGAMCLRAAIPIGSRTTTPELFDALARLGATLALRALADRPACEPQPDVGVTYAPKLTRADAKLDFTRDAAELDRRVRALTPWPGTYALLGGGVLKVLQAEPAAAETPPAGALATAEPGGALAAAATPGAPAAAKPPDAGAETRPVAASPAAAPALANPPVPSVGASTARAAARAGAEPASASASLADALAPAASAGAAPGTILAQDFTVACGTGALRLLRVQRAGRPAVPGADFLRGIAGWQTLRLT